MAFREEELEKWEQLVKTFIEEERLPEKVRSQVDLSYSIEDQSIEIFEIRPRWDKPEEKMQEPIAKTTWVRRQRVWKVYWQRADLKWHLYEPEPEAKTLKAFLNSVKEDRFACFWG